ncbi:septum formation initiator family protein [Aliamphritea spongicola]
MAALQYRLWFGEANLREVWALQDKIQSQQAENDLLVERNHRLQAEVQDLKRGWQPLKNVPAMTWVWCAKTKPSFS